MDILVLGLGRMGLTHLKAAKNLSHRVVGVFDIDPGRVNEVCRELDINPYRGESAQDLLEQTEADLAIIATTAPSHFELVMTALQTGVKKIICEKPFACSASEAEEMISAANAVDAVLSVNHQRRFMSQYQLVKDAIKTERLGSFRSMTVSAANIGLSMNGIHYFEAFSWLAESPIQRVTAWLDDEKLTNPRGAQFVDYSGQVLAFTKNGQRIYLDIGNDLGNGIYITYGFTRGKIVTNEISGEMRIWERDSGFEHNSTHEYALPSSASTLHPAKHDLVESTMYVLSEIEVEGNYPTGPEGFNALLAVIAAIESNEKDSTPVNLNKISKPNAHYNWA